MNLTLQRSLKATLIWNFFALARGGYQTKCKENKNKSIALIAIKGNKIPPNP